MACSAQACQDQLSESKAKEQRSARAAAQATKAAEEARAIAAEEVKRATEDAKAATARAAKKALASEVKAAAEKAAADEEARRAGREREEAECRRQAHALRREEGAVALSRLAAEAVEVAREALRSLGGGFGHEVPSSPCSFQTTGEEGATTAAASSTLPMLPSLSSSWPLLLDQDLQVMKVGNLDC